MANMEQIERELIQYIDDSPNLSREDRLLHLKAIFSKHFDMEEAEHQLTINDFHEIIGFAKNHYLQTVLPMKISRREIYPSEVPQVMMIEAIIMYLNKFKLLRRLVRIDYNR